MDVEIVDQDPQIELAYMVFMGAVEDLRSSALILSRTTACDIADGLIDGTFLADFGDEYTAKVVRSFSKTLSVYREARDYFMSPGSNARFHANVVGLDGEAPVSKMRTECTLPFNSKLAADACDAFMSARMKFANKKAKA